MIYGAMLVRNERGRYLEWVLRQMQSTCDRLIVLDDCSCDDTPLICKGYGAEVYPSDRSYWGTDELVQRKRLWELATHEAKDGDWILCLDADETIQGIDRLPELLARAEVCGVDGVSFNLYDMWSPTHYRDDELWNAHTRDWVMCIRYDPTKDYVWRQTSLHCGRFPISACSRIGQTGLALQHWGWSRPEDRKAKYERYMEADPEGKNGSLAQYQSILDPNPALRRFEP